MCILVDEITETIDEEKSVSVSKSRKKSAKTKTIKKKSVKSMSSIKSVLDLMTKDLKTCRWQNQGNQIPFQILFDKFPIKISDLPTEVPYGNKTDKSYLIQVNVLISSFLIVY